MLRNILAFHGYAECSEWHFFAFVLRVHSRQFGYCVRNGGWTSFLFVDTFILRNNYAGLNETTKRNAGDHT